MAIDATTIIFNGFVIDGDDVIYSMVLVADDFNDYVTAVGEIEGAVIDDAGPQTGDEYPVLVRCSMNDHGMPGAAYNLCQTFNVEI